MEKIKRNSGLFIWFFLFLLPFTDITNNFLLQQGLLAGNIGQAVKGIILLLLFIFFTSKRERYLAIIGGLGFFLLSLFHAYSASLPWNQFFADLLFFVKIVSYPLALWGMHALIQYTAKNSPHFKNILLALFIWTWLLYSLSAILTLFGFGQTQYLSGGGLKGYFYGGNEFSLSYLAITATILVLLASSGRMKLLIWSILALAVSFIIGMKTAMLGVLLAITSAFILLPQDKMLPFIKKNLPWLIPSVILLFIGGAIILTKQNFFYRLQFLTDRGVFSFITGERSPIAKTALHVYSEDFTISEKLLGIGKTTAEKEIGTAYFGYQKPKSTEMDPVDLLMYGGAVSLLLVYTPWILTLVQGVKTIKQRTKYETYTLILSLILLCISILAGHVIYSGLALFYIAMLFNLPQEKQAHKPLLAYIGATSHGGIRTYILQTAAHLKKVGLDTIIVNTHYLAKVKTILIFPFAMLSLLILSIKGVLTNRPVIFHYHMATRGSFLRKTLLALIFYFLTDSQILHLHSGNTVDFFEHMKKNLGSRFLLMVSLSLFDKVIVVSPTLLTEIKESVRPLLYFNRKKQQWFELSNAIEVPKKLPTPLPYKKGDVLKLLFVGRFEEAKNIPLIIEIAKEIKKQKLPITITLVGDGSLMPFVKTQIQKHGLEASISLKGWIQHAEIDSIYATHHAFLIPSKYESFGIVVLEAYKNGLPAIASHTGGLRDIVLQGETGYCITEDTGISYTSVLQQYIDTPALLAEQQTYVQTYVKKYNYTEHIDKLLHIYEV